MAASVCVCVCVCVYVFMRMGVCARARVYVVTAVTLLPGRAGLNSGCAPQTGRLARLNALCRRREQPRFIPPERRRLLLAQPPAPSSLSLSSSPGI